MRKPLYIGNHGESGITHFRGMKGQSGNVGIAIGRCNKVKDRFQELLVGLWSSIMM